MRYREIMAGNIPHIDSPAEGITIAHNQKTCRSEACKKKFAVKKNHGPKSKQSDMMGFNSSASLSNRCRVMSPSTNERIRRRMIRPSNVGLYSSTRLKALFVFSSSQFLPPSAKNKMLQRYSPIEAPVRDVSFILKTCVRSHLITRLLMSPHR
jgi:hypothetical protein